MIRFFVRLSGFLLLAAGFVSLVIDGTRSIAASTLIITPAGEAWSTWSPTTYDAFRNTIDRVISPWAPWVWDPMLVTALFVPMFVLLGGLGFVLLVLGRRPQTQIGWSSRD